MINGNLCADCLYPLMDIKHECFQEYENECSFVLWYGICSAGCPWCSFKNVLNDNKQWFRYAFPEIIKDHTEMETAIVFLGGEALENYPMLRKGCELAQSLNLKRKLYTNGLHLDDLKKLIRDGLLNSVSVDFKYPYSQKKYEDIEELIRLCNFTDTLIEFRTTLQPELTDEVINIMDDQMEYLKSEMLATVGEFGSLNKLDFKYIKQRFIKPIEET